MYTNRIVHFEKWCHFCANLTRVATLIIMASLILSLTVLNSQWLPVHAQDAPVLRIQAPKSVGAGQVILLQLVIEGKSPKDIGGLEAEVLYNHQAAEYAGFS